MISAAYQHLKPSLLGQVADGGQEAKNQLLFLEEAYAVLSSPEKRANYDKLISNASSRSSSTSIESYRTESTFLSWWGDSLTVKLFGAIGIFAAVFAVYKFTGQQGTQKIQEVREIGTVQNEGYRAETERNLVQGAVKNQDKLIDKSYDIAAIEAERRRLELEYRANAGAQQLELQRQRQEAALQEQRWRQEQYEKEQRAREARAAAEAPKRQLCNMYAVSGNTREAQAAGCNRYY